MSAWLPLVLAALWLVVANVIAMFPSPRTHHWPAAKVLIATGLPLIVWIFWENGPLYGIPILLAGLSILRWPVRFLIRWTRRQWARLRGADG